MKSLLAFVVLVAVVTAAPKRQRNLEKYIPRHVLMKPKIEKPAPSGKIVGGVEAEPHSWPHQVALFIDDMYFCGGSIIENKKILTAAHCMDGASSVEVVAGAHNIRQNEESQVSITSRDFTVHEGWSSFNLANDVSVINLHQPLTFNENIQAVKLATSKPSVGTIVTPSGWGRPSDSATGISEVLRQVDVPIMSTTKCDSYYGIVTENQVCIDATGGKGTCNGDSGGPLNYDDTTIGITSFGSSAGCEAGYPDAFTNVAAYVDWINRN